MAQILVEKIGEQNYAPEGAKAINAYAYGDASGLSLGRLIMAVCIRRAAVLEASGVNKMNQLSSTTDWLEALASVTSQVAREPHTGVKARLKRYTPVKTPSQEPSIREFLIYECGLPEQSVPVNLSSPDERTKLMDQYKPLMDKASTASQTQTIELQSLISRRDFIYNLSSSTSKSTMSAAMSLASLF